MTAPHPSTGDLKKQLLSLTSQAKQAQLAEHTPRRNVTVGNSTYEWQSGAERFPGHFQPYQLVTDPKAQALQDKFNALYEAQRARNENAWAKDHDLGTVAGTLKQLDASATQGAARMADWGIQLPLTQAHSSLMEGVDDRAIDIYNREYALRELNALRSQALEASLKGSVSPEDLETFLSHVDGRIAEIPAPTDDDLAYLESPSHLSAENAPAFVPSILGGSAPQAMHGARGSFRDVLDAAVATVNQKQELGTPFSDMAAGIVNTRNRDALDAELSESWDKHKDHFDKAATAWEKGSKPRAVWETAQGVAKLAFDGTGDILSNPAATFEYLAENAPQLAAMGSSPVLAAGINYAYAQGIYSEALQEYSELHGNAVPTRDQQREILAWSLAAGAANYVGDSAIIRPLTQRMSKMLPSGFVTKVASEVATSAAGKAANNAVTRTVGSAASGAAIEAAAEGFQTAVEDGFSKLVTPDGEQVFKGAAIGGGVGGAVSGGGQVAVEASAAAGSAVTKIRENARARQEKRQAAEAETARKQSIFDEAVETGDVSAFLDSESPDYNPEQAVAALTKRASEKELSAEEKLVLRQQVGQTVAALEEQAQALVAEKEAIVPKEGEASYEARLESIEKRIADTDESHPDHALLLQLQDTYRLNAERLEAIDEEIADIQGQVKRAQRAEDQLDAQSVPTPDEVSALVAATKAPNATISDSSEAVISSPEAERLTTLAMLDPEAFDDSTLDRLVNDTSHRLTTDQREIFRQLSEQRKRQNALKDTNAVQQNVLYGKYDKDGFRGLQEYGQVMVRSFRRGDRNSAERHLTQLRDFLASHTNKQAALKQAMAERKGEQVKYVSRVPETQNWRVLDAYPEGQSHRDAGDLKIPSGQEGTNKGKALLKAITAEKQAIQATYDSLSSQFNTLFNATDSGAQNVNSTPQAELVRTDTPQTQETSLADTRSDVAAQPTETSADEELDQAALDEYFQESPQDSETSLDEQIAQELARLAAEPPTAKAERQRQAVAEEEAQTETQPEAITSPEDDTELEVGSPEWEAQMEAAYQAEMEAREDAAAARAEAILDISEGRGLTPQQVAELGLESGIADGMNNPKVMVKDSPLTAEQFKNANYLFTFFRQKADGSRPLVAVKNFVDNWLANSQLLDYFVPIRNGKQGLRDHEKPYVEGLARFIKKHRAQIDRNLTRSDWHPAEMYRDFLSNFRPEEGSKYRPAELVPQNWRDAILVGSYVWLADTSRLSGDNHDGEIRNIFGLGKDEALPPSAYDEAGTGQRRDFVVSDLGRTIAEVLGLTEAASPHVPVNFRTKLHEALGLQALHFMEQAGYIKEERRNLAKVFEEIKAAREEGQLLPDVPRAGEQAQPEGFVKGASVYEGQVPFIVLVRDSDKSPKDPALKWLAEVSRGTNQILEKTFGASPRLSTPTLEPVKAKTSIRGTTRTVSKRQQDVLDASDSRPRGLNRDFVEFTEQFNDEVFLKIAGYQDMEGESPRVTHTVNRKSTLAKNEGKLREFNYLKELVASLREEPDGLDTDIFFTSVVWNQYRAGLESNTVDPQGSKMHRAFINFKAWSTTFNPFEESEAHTNFLLGVALGFGLKVDKQNPLKTLTQLSELMSEQDTLELLEDINAVPEGEALPLELQERIAEWVSGREEVQSLYALREYARYFAATRSPDKAEFTTSLSVEVDGLTNGPAFSHIHLGVISKLLGHKFGFFDAESGFSSFAEAKENTPGFTDLYEALTQRVLELVDSGSTVFRGIQAFMGNFTAVDGSLSSTGRNLAKPIITPVGFGAGVNKTLTASEDGFIQSFYDTLEAVANGEGRFENVPAAERTTEIQLLVQQWNQDILGGSLPLKVPQTIQQAMRLEMTPAQEALAREAYRQTLGTHIESALDEQFGEFFEMRNTFTEASQKLFNVYQALYDVEREQAIRELEANGMPPIRVEGTRNGEKVQHPYRDLTPQEKQTIARRLGEAIPILETAFSKEGGSLENGIELFKTQQDMTVAGDSDYRSQVKFGDKASNKASQSAQGMRNRLADPGSKAVPTATHSFDSWVASMAYEAFPALNVHDGIGFGLQDALAGAQKLNQATFQGLVNFSMPLEMLNTIDRSIAAAEALLDQRPDDFTKRRAQKQLEALKEFREAFKHKAFQAEFNKLTFLRGTVVVDQYVMPGGAYHVSDADHAMVDQRLAELKERWSKEVSSQTLEPVVRPERVPTQPVETPWGPVGKATAESSPRLVQALRKLTAADGTVPVEKLMSVLRKEIRDSGEPPAVKQFQDKLLQTVVRGLRERNFKVRYITPYTPNVDNNAPPKARGWYTLGEDYVAIKGPEFVHSAVTSETVLHELTHGLVAASLEALPEDSPIVQELSQILTKAREFLDANPKLTGFSPAVGRRKNGGGWPEVTRDQLQELVAWGMTNPAFQRQVLGQIKFHSYNYGLLNGFRSFIKSLVDLLFGTVTIKDETAMAGLLINVGALFNDTQAKSMHNTAHTLASTDPTDRLTPLQTYEALGRTNGVSNPTYDAHLRSVLSGVVTTVFGHEGPVPALAEAQAAMTPDDVYLNALASGQMPFASRAVGILKLNAQEAFVLESVELAVKEAIEGSQVTYNELRRLFNEVRKQVTPKDFHAGDWSQATPDERAAAEEVHKFIFTKEANADGTSDFLSRFAAVGMAYQPLYNKLQSLRPRTASEAAPKTFAQLLVHWFNKAMRALSEWLTNTHEGQSGYEKLEALSNKLAQLHAKRKAGIKAEGFSVEGTFNQALQTGMGALREGLLDIAQSELVQNSTSTLVKAGRTTAKIVGGRISGDVLDSLKKQRDAYTSEKLGLMGQLVQDIRGLKPALSVWNAFLRTAKKFEGRRKEVIEGHAKLVRDLLPKMSKQESASLSRLLKLDVVSLLDDFGTEGIQSLLRDDKRVETEIRRLRRQLPAAFRDDYIIHSVALGRQMATGEWHIPIGFENAYLMARLEGIADTSRLSEAELNRIEGVLEQLATLEGILASSRISRETVATVMETAEGAEGVTSVLKLYRSLKEDALEKNFNGHKALMRKGYTKDIMNPRVKLKLATEREGRALERAGFSKGMALPKDPTDANREQLYMYKLDGMGLNARVTGIFSNTGETARGSTMNAGLWDEANDRVNTYNFKELQTANSRAFKAYQQLKSRPGFDPRKHDRKYRKAIRNESGEVVNFSYVMSERVRDDLMERDNSVDKVIGALAGSIFDKSETKTLNRNTVDALWEQYQADLGNVAEGTEAYIEFGPNSQDPEIAENYRLLPDDTKRYIKEKWGTQHMLVRNDLYQMLFGYRKYSIANNLAQDATQQKAVGEFMTKILAWSFSDKDIPVEDMSEVKAARLLRAQLNLRRGEDIWVSIAYMVKDNWVIKNFFTSWANELANNTELWALGIPIKDIVRNKVIAFKGIISYQKDKERLNELEWRLQADLVGPDKAAVEQEIIELRDAMKRNPVSFMIEEGLFQTIVEDVAQEMDPYAYQNRLVQWTEDKVDKHVPQWAKTVGKTLFMTHDTPIYKIMNRFPSYSDFAARYAVYQHFTQKKGMEHAKAIQLAEDAFVNYDMPQHKALQYVNDTGLLPFTKYYIRIQRVLFHILEENPARMLSIVLASNMFPSLPFISESFFWEKLEHSPLRDGVFEWPGSIGEIATVKAAMNVLQ